MKLLLDTHVWLWWLSERERLPGTLHGALENGGNELFLSVVSSREIAIKNALGKLALREPPTAFVEGGLLRDGRSTLSIKHWHALAVAGFPFHHHDPVDRLLIAQALGDSMLLAVVDPKMEAYDVELLCSAEGERGGR